MAKKFDIHEWKAKQRLAELDDFTPDLEDDELKRSKIQQMMAKEKPKTPQEVPQGTLNNTIADLAEMYSYGEILDALKVFYADNDELPFAEMAKKHAKEFRDFLDSEEELDEQNVTGTGASFNAGAGMGHFGKKKKKRKNTPSGDMAYTQKVNENEEEELGVDWSIATDDQIRAIGGDVYYGSDQSPEPTDDGGQRMLVPPEDGWPQIGDTDGDGDVDVDDVNFDDPDGGAEKKIVPPRDVDYLHNMMLQKINNRQEYGPFVRAVLEMDVPQKTAAFQQTFKDLTAFKNLLIKHFGDEDDKSTKYSWSSDKKNDEEIAGGKPSSSLIDKAGFEPFDYGKGKIDTGFSRRMKRDAEKGAEFFGIGKKGRIKKKNKK
jgi:hypothetical protein